MERAFIVFVCVISAVLGSPATQVACPEETKCTVSNVDITPCENANNCVLKRTTEASIRFDIQPHFAANELNAEVSWNGIRFTELDSNACKYTACPTQSGVTQTFAYAVIIGADLPKSNYTIKWKIWNKDNEGDLCCFSTNIRLK